MKGGAFNKTGKYHNTSKNDNDGISHGLKLKFLLSGLKTTTTTASPSSTTTTTTISLKKNHTK